VGRLSEGYGLVSELAAAIRHIPIPETMAWLAIDRRGFPVPWFVSWEDGEPDFRVIARGRIVKAVKESRCWVCGHKLGRLKVSVIGPMCAVNRVSSEPPSHPQCARYSVQACPFLTQPRMRRNDRDLPPERIDPGGFHIDRNPGVSVLWSSLHPSKPFAASIGNAGVLFQLGAPHAVEWWTQRRRARRSEALAALESGMPTLREVAEREGNGAVEALAEATTGAMRLLPEMAA
jgi:hypothetical protein